MVVQNTGSIDYKDLYAKYDWFQKNFPPVIQKISDEFFLEGFKFELIGISKNVNMLMNNDSYFVTKIRIDKQHDMFFRSSEKTIGIILDNALGKAGRRFNLNKMTDLEAKVITAFNDYLYNAMVQFLSEPPPTLKRMNFDIIHLTFLLTDINDGTTDKFIISLPDVLLKPDIITPKGSKFDNTSFSKSTIETTIKIGTTRFPLIDIKSLDIDDIVVFENSNVNTLHLHFKDYIKDIKINPNLGLVLPVDNDGGNNMGNTENTNLWDSIEVEMNAQFDTVKITLGELKNIEDGLVVDLTSIYDNRVTLSVEDKPIARGELVIVNDRYGVKVNEIIAETNKAKPTKQKAKDSGEFGEEMAVEEDELSAAFDDEDMGDAFEGGGADEGGDEEDEFDYSDFELEDEDI